jgi:hypothetical protein
MKNEAEKRRNKHLDLVNQKPSRRARCPVCGKYDVVIPILYGIPTDKDFQKAAGGQVHLGGCCPRINRFFCKRDNSEFF